MDEKQYDTQVIMYGISTFSFLLTEGHSGLTLGEFADIIEKHYEKDQPQVAEVCRVFRKHEQGKME